MVMVVVLECFNSKKDFKTPAESFGTKRSFRSHQCTTNFKNKPKRKALLLENGSNTANADKSGHVTV